jgi:hypothetical protein
MKITEGKLVTLIKIEESESQELQDEFLLQHPDLDLIDIHTLPSGKETWYWYVDRTIYRDGKIVIPLHDKTLLIFDPCYARIMIRLPGEEKLKSYLEFASETIDTFNENNEVVVYLPKVEGGDIKVISGGWLKERENCIKILRELCQEFGDNTWTDDMNLADVLEKHLAKHMRKEVKK